MLVYSGECLTPIGIQILIFNQILTSKNQHLVLCFLFFFFTTIDREAIIWSVKQSYIVGFTMEIEYVAIYKATEKLYNSKNS